MTYESHYDTIFSLFFAEFAAIMNLNNAQQ